MDRLFAGAVTPDSRQLTCNLRSKIHPINQAHSEASATVGFRSGKDLISDESGGVATRCQANS